MPFNSTSLYKMSAVIQTSEAVPKAAIPPADAARNAMTTMTRMTISKHIGSPEGSGTNTCGRKCRRRHKQIQLFGVYKP